MPAACDEQARQISSTSYGGKSTYQDRIHSSHLKNLTPKVEDGFWMMGGKGIGPDCFFFLFSSTVHTPVRIQILPILATIVYLHSKITTSLQSAIIFYFPSSPPTPLSLSLSPPTHTTSPLDSTSPLLYFSQTER